jgi:hypothetical protein
MVFVWGVYLLDLGREEGIMWGRVPGVQLNRFPSRVSLSAIVGGVLMTEPL